MTHSRSHSPCRRAVNRRTFLKLAGAGLVGAAGLPARPTRPPFRGATLASIEAQLRERSLLTFTRFAEVWNFNDFWKRGNTFDACLRFSAALAERWPEDEEVRRIQHTVREMLQENLVFFRRFDPGDLWADDFGWWGLMALNARRHLLRLGDEALAAEYLTLSTDLCWEYKKNTAYDHTPDARPVPHGCRNGDANGRSRGVKNTVTNVLLFLLSSRIYRLFQAEGLSGGDKFLDMAYRQWVWFSAWFGLGEYAYLKAFGDEAALVQERPMAVFEGSDYQDTTHPPWAEGWVWTGDQGMLVGALTDLIAVKDQLADTLARTRPDAAFDPARFDREAHGIIRRIGRGVQQALVGATDGLLREAPCLSSFGPRHGNDYLAGRGILLRYLGAPEEQALLGVDLSASVSATAEAIWATRDPSTNQFQPEYTAEQDDRAYIGQFRQLWGLADDVVRWELSAMHPQNRDGVCQAVGMDLLGAAIRAL